MKETADRAGGARAWETIPGALFRVISEVLSAQVQEARTRLTRSRARSPGGAGLMRTWPRATCAFSINQADPRRLFTRDLDGRYTGQLSWPGAEL